MMCVFRGVLVFHMAAVQTSVNLDALSPEKSEPPFVLPQAFNPAEILGADPAAWISVLRGLTVKLPVQLHCEPFNIKDTDLPNCQPIFRNAVKCLNAIPELAELMRTFNNSGKHHNPLPPCFSPVLPIINSDKMVPHLANLLLSTFFL